MSTRTSAGVCLFLITLSIVIGVCAYPHLGEKVISHWNTVGEPDGYMPRFFGAFLAPIIAFFMFLLVFFAPRLDPMKANIAYFRKYYDGLAILFILFFLYLQIITLLLNLGYTSNIVQLLSPAIGGLFFYLGIVIRHTRRNWVAGIRTPWTLSSDEVWQKTHARSGYLFQTAGFIALLGFAFPKLSFFLIFVPVVMAALYGVVYSYILYRKLNVPVTKKKGRS